MIIVGDRGEYERPKQRALVVGWVITLIMTFSVGPMEILVSISQRSIYFLIRLAQDFT